MQGATLIVVIVPLLEVRSNDVSLILPIIPVVDETGWFPPQFDVLPDKTPLILFMTLFPLTTEEKLKGYRAVTDPLKAGLTPAPYA